MKDVPGKKREFSNPQFNKKTLTYTMEITTTIK